MCTTLTPRGRGSKEAASGGNEVTKAGPLGKESDTGFEGYKEDTEIKVSISKCQNKTT